MSIPTLEGLHNGSLGGASGGDRLGRELALGFALDAKRKAEDTMKKRAIHTATSYDDFKNLVACASQTPLASGDFSSRVELNANHMIGGTARGLAAPCDLGMLSPFAGVAGGVAVHAAGDGGVAAARARDGGVSWGAPPASCLELDRAFRRHSVPTVRGDFIRWLGPSRLGACFRRDVDPAVLGVIFTLIAAWIREGASAEAVEIAVGVAASANPSALSRAIDMLDAKERTDITLIIEAAEGTDAELLKKAFA